MFKIGTSLQILSLSLSVYAFSTPFCQACDQQCYNNCVEGCADCQGWSCAGCYSGCEQQCGCN